MRQGKDRVIKTEPKDMYLDLLKKTLSFTLWPEPPAPLDAVSVGRGPLKKAFVSSLTKLLMRKQLQLMRINNCSSGDREQGVIRPAYADTMIGLKRLDSLQTCVETVVSDNVPGDLIEAGVWRGGACILMRAVLSVLGVTDRKVYVADSFEGLPKPDAVAYPADAGDTHHMDASLAVSQAEVEANFRKYDLLDDQVVFLKGWFQDTLPDAPMEKLAILRLDGDMFGSTMEILNSLYSRLSSGGFCIVDDYGLTGCQKAIDEFRATHGIDEEMQVVDWTGMYWRKK